MLCMPYRIYYIYRLDQCTVLGEEFPLIEVPFHVSSFWALNGHCGILGGGGGGMLYVIWLHRYVSLQSIDQWWNSIEWLEKIQKQNAVLLHSV